MRRHRSSETKANRISPPPLAALPAYARTHMYGVYTRGSALATRVSAFVLSANLSRLRQGWGYPRRDYTYATIACHRARCEHVSHLPTSNSLIYLFYFYFIHVLERSSLFFFHRFFFLFFHPLQQIILPAFDNIAAVFPFYYLKKNFFRSLSRLSGI